MNALTPPLHRWHEQTEPQSTGFVVGVDLGQSKDYTAIIVNERKTATETTFARARFEPTPQIEERKEVVHHSLVFMHRPALGTPYPKIIDQVRVLLADLPTRSEPPSLVVDATGVGRPCVDLFRKEGLDPIALTITGGEQVNRVTSRDVRVPKRILAGLLQVVLQTGRLKIAKGLPHVETLVNELENFKVKISVSGNESFEAWRESVHDDLVLSTAMAVWQAENRPQPVRHLLNRMWDL